MSYSIIRKATVNQEGICCEVAESNIYPTYWSDYTIKTENIPTFFVSALDGSIRIQSNCRKIYRIFKEIKEINVQFNLFEKELNAHLGYYNFSTEGNNLLAEYATSKVLDTKPRLTLTEIEQKFRELDTQLDEAIKQRDALYEKEKKILICSATISRMVTYKEEECVLCVDYHDNMYVCPQSLYNNKGTLDNASNEAVNIGTYTSRLYDLMRDTRWMHEYPKYEKELSADKNMRNRYLNTLQLLSSKGYKVKLKVEPLQTLQITEEKEKLAIDFFSGKAELVEIKKRLPNSVSYLLKSDEKLICNLIQFLNKEHEGLLYEIKIA